MVIILSAIIGVILVWLYGKFKRRNSHKVDYSFGLKIAREIGTELRKRNYSKVEDLFLGLNSDDLTQTVDYISLKFPEEKLKAWVDANEESELPRLMLGVFYSHMAWIKRGHAYANELSGEQKMGFWEYMELAQEWLAKIEKSVTLKEEAYARLIRVSMGLSDRESVIQYFNKCVELNPQHVWAHVHLSEAIQPKWGGSKDMVSDYFSGLSANSLIKNIVLLKFIWDSIVTEDNLFSEDAGLDKLKKHARVKITEMDKEIEEEKTTSIHRYVLYCYLMVISEELGETSLTKKYYAKINGYYTLYPFGIKK